MTSVSRDDQEVMCGKRKRRPFTNLALAFGYCWLWNEVVIGEGVGCSSCSKLPCPVVVGRHVSVRSLCDECF